MLSVCVCVCVCEMFVSLASSTVHSSNEGHVSMTSAPFPSAYKSATFEAIYYAWVSISSETDTHIDIA